jgi:CRP-like cAMP-binding protein
VLIRLAERGRATSLERGERRTTEDTVWVLARGRLAIAGAAPGSVLGMIRVVRADTPPIELLAEEASELIALTVDDLRDVLEEDPAALAALADRLAALLLAEETA